MKLKHFKITYPKGGVFILKAKSRRTLDNRLGDIVNDLTVKEVKKGRTGLRKK